MASEGGGTPTDLAAGEPAPGPPGGGAVVSGTPGSAPAWAGVHALSVEQRLFEECFTFDFFQAVRLLQRLDPSRVPVGRGGPPRKEVVRFRAHISLSFPASAVHDLLLPSSALPVPILVQTFMGMTGPSGVLPRHYTELLFRLERDAKGPEKHALRDWLDLFNHRLVSLFYLAWEKYRFYVPYERNDQDRAEPDLFTTCLFSFVGLAPPPLRNRLRITTEELVDHDVQEKVLARIADLHLFRYAGLLGHRPRCPIALEAILADYFQVAASIKQFQGQWLPIEPAGRSYLLNEPGNNQLGVSAVIGERVWDIQSKFRVRLGPLGYAQFVDLLPDRAPKEERKGFFLLVKLVRLYVEPTFDFDVQLVLGADEVPECELSGAPAFGARLGWNTWLRTGPMAHDVDDAVFEGSDVVHLDEN
jgi:type VI secretion system protein ImpH